MPYYVVRKGHKPGIYTSWKDAEKQIKGYPRAEFKKIKTKDEADYYKKTGKVYPTDPNTKKETKRVIQIGKTGINTIQRKTVQKKITDIKGYTTISIESGKPKIEKKSSRISVWTDGSAINNGKPNCKAGCGVFFGSGDSRNVSLRITDRPSNQRAELQAILIALESIPEKEKVKVYTDSKYSIKCITEWATNWKINGWKTTKEQPVKHKDIIKKLYKMYKKRDIKFVHVRSHQAPPRNTKSKEYKIWYGNDQADQLANESLKMMIV